MAGKLMKTAAAGAATLAGAQAAVVGGLLLWDRHRQKERGSRRPPQPGLFGTEVEESQMTIYTAGGPLFDDMVAAIDSAQTSVMLQTYIWQNDAVGRRIMDALNAAAARGVQVYVIYDLYGNHTVPRSFFGQLDPRISSHRMPPLQSQIWRGPIRYTGLSHSKILVVDDETGFVGGFNIGDEFAREWRDTHVREVGPAVWDLRQAFANVWNEGRSGSTRIGWIPPQSWNPRVRVASNLPVQLVYPIRHMYLKAIERAEDRIWLTTPYFVPDQQVLKPLMRAARRGVDVRIMLPKESNHVVVDWVTRGFYTDMLEAGVKVLLYTPAMIHSKTATIDGVWSTIGTANIDRLSLGLNYETNLEVIDEGFAAEVEKVFEADAEHCELLTAEEWQQRPQAVRAVELALLPLRGIL
ncbi:phosphatidylserine/phosphatidylglycerophosphate/cardiolipin synthase family protein [Nesterenkonia sp. NBAIMH1]|uniref:phospholipase D-like domain-containing protein n=1 Tax=Nesterenkonia sp. NBAIMH1 TaxID=2600320 RepID=UPI0011B3CBE0|nr:phospholipase D-like domain-containing protein [Nesterenkonia sp. NBAIMH1]